MHVAALAEALVSLRRSDGSVSLHDLQERLSRSGHDELARAVASLSRRSTRESRSGVHPDKHPWI